MYLRIHTDTHVYICNDQRKGPEFEREQGGRYIRGGVGKGREEMMQLCCNFINHYKCLNPVSGVPFLYLEMFSYTNTSVLQRSTE